LVWYDKTVIWSRGAQIFRKYSFEYEGEDVSYALFVHFKRGQSSSGNGKGKAVDTGDGIFGPFHTSQKYHWGGPRVPSSTSFSTNDIERLQRTLIIFLRTRAHIYFPSGEDIIINIPFAVDVAWPLKEGGVVVQRALEKREIRRMKRDKQSVLRGMDHSSVSILDDLSDMENDQAPSLPRLYTLDDPFQELKMIVEGELGAIDRQILSTSTPIPATSTLLYLSSSDPPMAIVHDHDEGMIIFYRHSPVPTTPVAPLPPTPGPRTMRPEDILKPPEPHTKQRPTLQRNPSSVMMTKDRRLSTADPFDRSHRRNQPRTSRGNEVDQGARNDLQEALKPTPVVQAFAAPIPKARMRGLSVVSVAGTADNRRTSGASAFLRQDVNDHINKNALHIAGDLDLRETTMMMGLEREETELRSDVVLERIWTWLLPS